MITNYTDMKNYEGGSTARGWPQGGMCLTLLWNLVVSELSWKLRDYHHYHHHHHTIEYADDIALIISGTILQTMSELLRTNPGTVQQWCNRTHLSVNPNKAVIIPFTRKRDIRGLKEPIKLSIFPMRSSTFD
jgi:hypothetical protein